MVREKCEGRTMLTKKNVELIQVLSIIKNITNVQQLM